MTVFLRNRKKRHVPFPPCCFLLLPQIQGYNKFAKATVRLAYWSKLNLNIISESMGILTPEFFFYNLSSKKKGKMD
jgi:hypothetical protein